MRRKDRLTHDPIEIVTDEDASVQWQLIGFAALLVLVCACSSRDVETPESGPKNTLGEVQSMEQRHAARRQIYLQSITSATSDEQRLKTAKEFSSYMVPAIDEMLAIAERQPSTTVGKRATIWVVSSCDPDYEPHQRAATILLKYHTDAAELADVCQHLAGFDPVYEQLLRRLASSNPSRDCRAQATFELADLLIERADFQDTMNARPQLRAERVKNMGAQLVKHLESLNRDQDRSEARQLYAKVRREFSDVAYRGGTLGDAAAERLLPLNQTYPELGERAPKLVGTDLRSKSLALEDHQGKVVVITFWASWCGACLDRVPEENRLIEAFKDADFQFFGVNGDETIDDALQAVEEYSIQFRSWWDNPAAKTRIANQWGVTTWPTTFVVDQSGIIRYKNLSGPDLHRVVTELLTQSDKSAATKSP